MSTLIGFEWSQHGWDFRALCDKDLRIEYRSESDHPFDAIECEMVKQRAIDALDSGDVFRIHAEKASPDQIYILRAKTVVLSPFL